jgi:hypothetical protein
MILGMSIDTFVIVHVIISLIGIVAGFPVLFGMLKAERRPGWTAIFLIFTILTSVTGFMFPFTAVTPAFAFGVISSIVLALTLLALYVFKLTGAWRWVYVVTALFAFYLNCFVLIVQSFQKIPFLNAFAPTQSEPPFAIAQGILLVFFLVLGFRAVRRFHPPAAAMAYA